ncbi:hypothetical protein F2P56_012564 [Juglans regia]|uniref:No apical meristem-associated C-terminal domain-containing protein n=1 Tax=Juglans regia TaxID=51240 RepID=A0A833XMQ3_JUGRE|nr:hypothetical protein F2P56_012564 [Juglans regia]
MEKTNFKMEHCWCLRRHQPKWQQHIMTLGTRRRPHDKRLAIEQESEVASHIVEENVEVLGERPLGKKAEKKREMKQKSWEGHDTEINMGLARMTDDRHRCMVEQRTTVLKADHDRSAEFELTKKKFETKMMRLDLAGMNVTQQKYFLNI